MTEAIRILLVEDNMGDARLLRETLRDAGEPGWFELTHVTRLEEGLVRMTTSRFDIVLLDLSLPDAHGLETLSRARAHCGGTPIVVMTGTNDETLAIKAVQEGAQDYLVKGIAESHTVVRSIRYGIERQRLIAELAQANELQRHLANHDALTGMPNRQLFYDRLEQCFAHARRETKAVAVLFFDLDDFKLKNDSLGHDAGDRILKTIAKRVASTIRASDTAARLGGDEFTFILYDVEGPEDVARVAHNLLDTIAEPITIDANELHVTASAGISMFPADGEDVETIIRNADMAMYRAKAAGRNTYQFFLPAMNERALQRMDMEHRLRFAMERGQIRVAYQPKVDLRSGRITGMEALARWRMPGGSFVQPSEFIALAEETGLIVPLGEQILRTACEQVREWHAGGFRDIHVAVNLSPRQLQQRPSLRGTREDIVDMIERTLSETGIEPAALKLEVTESAVLRDTDAGLSVLARLRDRGIGIAIDDFGTGYSSLNYLKVLPAQELKIDRSFIRMLNHDGPDAAIVQAIITMAHSLELSVVAEGVETMEQYRRLRGLQCDEMQGYLVSPAVPGDEATKLLEAYAKARKPAA
jgi:diguanylate cyclase (GGDEF)-like protein